MVILFDLYYNVKKKIINDLLLGKGANSEKYF